MDVLTLLWYSFIFTSFFLIWHIVYNINKITHITNRRSVCWRLLWYPENPDLLKYYQQYTVEYIKFFEGAFTMGIQMGEFETHNVKTSAVTLMAALDGVVGGMLFDEDLVLEEVMQHFEEKFIKSIEKTG